MLVKSHLKQEKMCRTAAALSMNQIPHPQLKNRSLTVHLHILPKRKRFDYLPVMVQASLYSL